MNWLGQVLNSQETLAGAIILVAAFTVFAFSRNWILTSSQIKGQLDAAKQRGDEWKAAYDKQSEALKLAMDQVDRLKNVGDTANRVLNSLPSPPKQGTDEEVHP